MINHLAEHVIDMLHLINKYKESLKDRSRIESTIELLEHSSQVIDSYLQRPQTKNRLEWQKTPSALNWDFDT